MSHLGSKYEKQDVAFMYYGYMHECRRRVARMWRAKLRDILTKTTSTSTTVKQLRFNNNWDSAAIKTSQAWRYKTRVNKQSFFLAKKINFLPSNDQQEQINYLEIWFCYC